MIYDPREPSQVTIVGEDTTGPILVIVMIVLASVGFAMVAMSGWHYLKRRWRIFAANRRARRAQ